MNTEWKYAMINLLRAVLTEKSQFMFFETLILGYSKNTFYILFFVIVMLGEKIFQE